MSERLNILTVFSEVDNHTDKQSHIGWVDQFKKLLPLIIKQVTGTLTDMILCDDRRSYTDIESLDKCEFLMVIVSENFIASQNGIALLEQIEQHNPLIAHKRAIKIMKEPPVSELSQPALLQNIPTHHMPSILAESLKDGLHKEIEKKYWIEMLNVAYAIKRKRRGEVHIDKKSDTEKKIVFLAETTQDLFVERHIIKQELQRHKCIILPSLGLPEDEKAQKEMITKNLEKSDFSIHLIGKQDSVTESEQQKRSLIALQNQLAARQNIEAKRDKKNKLFRLIWICPSIKHAESEQQKAFVENIKRSISSQDKIEISEAPLEEFKSMVRLKLSESSNGKSKSIADIHDEASKSVYLIYDPIDEEDIKPYTKAIKNTGMRLITPFFSGNFTEVRKTHLERLFQFDIVIVFKNRAGMPWVRMKMLEILKSPGFGRKKPILGKAVVSSEDIAAELDDLSYTHTKFIKGNAGEQSLKAVKEFLLTSTQQKNG